ncbi:hypothetical protein [Marinigracilibium pacificum]|uniref:Uncharacterized protein n=1 Tax=Marinigracilibium pacificum TaxID=2729599 RepID=A0A848J3C9_9BACT|nr:hypothetical protein [Marinigracilibium pacificum]NMM47682.1 hypothetical protein [Marinigracilibium pacificum]
MRSKVIFLLLTIFCVKTPAQDKRTVKFIDEYLNCASDNINGKYGPVTKWDANIKSLKYKIVGDQNFVNKKRWDNFISEISQITGISLNRTEQNDYQILIYIGQFEDYQKIEKAKFSIDIRHNFGQWHWYTYNKNHSLKTYSHCIVPSKNHTPDKREFILKKALLNGLGLVGEIKDEYSIFYPFFLSSNKNLSRKDKRFIKLHYTKIITPGDNVSSLRKTLLELPEIEELSKEKI